MLFLRLVGHFESGNASGVKTIKCTVIEKQTHLSPFKTDCHMFIFNSLQDLQEWPVPSERDRSPSQRRHLTVCHNTNRTATGRKLFKQHGCIGAVCLRLQESMCRLLPGGPKTCFCVKELISNTRRRLCRLPHNPDRIFFLRCFLLLHGYFMALNVERHEADRGVNENNEVAGVHGV